MMKTALATCLAALGSGGLLPPPEDVQAALDALEEAGITAWSGWRYLSKLDSVGRDEVLGIASPWASLEDNYILKKLFETRFDVKNLIAPLGTPGAGDDILKLAEKYPNGQGLKLLGIPTESEALAARAAQGAFKAVLVMNNLQRDEPKENEQAPGERGARENPQPSCGQ